MPDLKISAMIPAVNMGNADIFPVVQSGVNASCSKELLLTAAPGEPIAIACQTSAELVISPAGQVNLSCTPGQIMQFISNGGTIKMNADGSINIIPPAGKVLDLGYFPQVPANWMGSPGSVWEAIDRIAQVLGAGGATPIP